MATNKFSCAVRLEEKLREQGGADFLDDLAERTEAIHGESHAGENIDWEDLSRAVADQVTESVHAALDALVPPLTGECFDVC
jgi:hypothetical protein